MYQAKDTMRTRVISVRPEATIEEAIRTLLESNASGAPVIDDAGRLVGIISEYQLLEVFYDPKLKSSPVSEFMTKDVITVDETALLATVANLFIVHRIHRVPVVREGRVVGIVSRRDLLRYILESGPRIDNFFDELKGCTTGNLLSLATYHGRQECLPHDLLGARAKKNQARLRGCGSRAWCKLSVT
jgi:CBS domain-containing protein